MSSDRLDVCAIRALLSEVPSRNRAEENDKEVADDPTPTSLDSGHHGEVEAGRVMFAFALVALLIIGLLYCVLRVLWKRAKAAESASDTRRRLAELNQEHGPTEPWDDFPDTASFNGEQDIQRQIDEIKASEGFMPDPPEQSDEGGRIVRP